MRPFSLPLDQKPHCRPLSPVVRDLSYLTLVSVLTSRLTDTIELTHQYEFPYLVFYTSGYPTQVTDDYQDDGRVSGFKIFRKHIVYINKPCPCGGDSFG